MKKTLKKVTNFSTMPDKEKKALISKAVKGANEEQARMMSTPQLDEGECHMPDCELVKIKHTHNHPNCSYSNIYSQDKKCCDNGNFGDGHECLKQPSEESDNEILVNTILEDRDKNYIKKSKVREIVERGRTNDSWHFPDEQHGCMHCAKNSVIDDILKEIDILDKK